MSGLYSIRKQVRDVLVDSGLWTCDEVLIKRRTNIWNDIAQATEASRSGQCLVIGVAKGNPVSGQQPGSRMLRMDIVIPITLVELPNLDPDGPEETADSDEDSRWEDTALLLQGHALGRSGLHYELDFDGFEDVEDKDYVIRQTVFKTRLIIKPKS